MAVKRKKKTTASRKGTKKTVQAKTRKQRKARPKSRSKAKRRTAARRTSARRGKRVAARTRSTGVTATNATPEEMAFIREHAAALSKTTKSAKWVHSPDEHEDRPGQSLATRSHEVIRRWAEERGAVPATIEGTRHGDRAGVLRLNFPGYASGEELEEIDWEEWFKTFDERNLVFLFQEHKRDGQQSNFFQFDSPYRERS